MTLPIVVDGRVRHDGRVSVLALGAGLQQGEGLFETLLLRKGRLGFWQRHLDRLVQGARELGLVPPASPEDWWQDLLKLKQATELDDLAVRLLLFRDGERIRRVVAATPATESSIIPVRVGAVHPALDGPRQLAHLKSLNYLVPRRAHAVGAEGGYDEVLFRDRFGRVLEGTRSSIFAVMGGELHTAPLSMPILPGVTRQVLLELAEELGTAARLRPFTEDDLRSAQEAFLTASLRGVRPIREVLGHGLSGAPGEVTRALGEAYGRRMEDPRECPLLTPQGPNP